MVPAPPAVALGEALRERLGLVHPAQVYDDLPPSARADVARAVIADVIGGKPVRVAEMLARPTTLTASTWPRSAAAKAPGATAMGSTSPRTAMSPSTMRGSWLATMPRSGRASRSGSRPIRSTSSTGTSRSASRASTSRPPSKILTRKDWSATSRTSPAASFTSRRSRPPPISAKTSTTSSPAPRVRLPPCARPAFPASSISTRVHAAKSKRPASSKPMTAGASPSMVSSSRAVQVRLRPKARREPGSIASSNRRPATTSSSTTS